MKKKILSGLQSTNSLTLGNYIGAMKNFIDLQNNHQLFIFVADLHSITIEFDPVQLALNRQNTACLYAACGLDFDNNIVFYQSAVQAHTVLSYLLLTHTYLGELNRMTQFKDKSLKLKKANQTINIPSGLLFYPCLMAADILLYDADLVPVGIDQKQHIELTRDLALRFNKKYHTKLFTVPDMLETKTGGKIMDLLNPDIKMSKTAHNQNGVIYLLDDLKLVEKKIMSAKTDSCNKIKYDLINQKAIANLITIYASLSNLSITEIENKYEHSSYKEFKVDLTHIVVSFLKKIQKRYYYYKNNIAHLETKMQKNAKIASDIANQKVALVQKTLGLNYS